MADSLILDILTFFGPNPPRAAIQPGTNALTELMKTHGVAGAVCISTRSMYYSAPAGNRETAHFCQQAGGILQPAALLDPRLPVASQFATGARLLALMPATQKYPIPFASLSDLLSGLKQIGSTVPIYVEASRPGDATQVQILIEKIGLTSPILFGGVNADCLVEVISVAKLNEKTSLVTNGFRGVGEVSFAVAGVGAERVVFGSDAPIHSLGAALALVRRADITPAARELVLGGNAKRILGAGGVAQ